MILLCFNKQLRNNYLSINRAIRFIPEFALFLTGLYKQLCANLPFGIFIVRHDSSIKKNCMPVQDDLPRKKHFHQLNEQEIANPYLVIDELFDFAHLPDVRELLWEWLKTTVTGSYHKNLSHNERYAMLTLYEKIEKLVEAVHILHERDRKSKKNEHTAAKEPKKQR